MPLFENFVFFNYEISPFSLSLVFTVIYISYYFIAVKEYPKLICKSNEFREYFEKHFILTRQIFWPLLWGFEGKMQTIMGCLVRPFSPVTYEREMIYLSDGGEVALDWSGSCMFQKTSVDVKSTSIPICVLLPGLTGCSQSNYMTHLVSSVVSKGFRAAVFNYRGKGGSKLKTPRTYCATSTQDFQEVIDHIQSKNPDIPIIACGISLGGMILFNYLANIGDKSPLEAAIVISVAWNINMSAASLERPINRILFNKTLAESLAHDIKTNSEIFESTMDLNPVYSSQTIREFDTHFTTRVFGYSSVDEYYQMASPHLKVSSIKIPLICLSAADDPFAPYESIPFDSIKTNPNVAMILTSHGGHVGFLEGIWPRGTTIMDRLLEQHLCGVFNNIDEFRKLRNKLNNTDNGT